MTAHELVLMGELADHIPDPNPCSDPLLALLAAEEGEGDERRAAVLRRLLDRLAPLDRFLVRSYYLDEPKLTDRQIAERLQVTRETAWAWRHRALRQMAEDPESRLLRVA